MGSHTILDILNNTNLRFKKILTISNNHHNILRSEMNKINYKVKSEQIIKENNKYYNLIYFEEGKTKYTNSELLLGLNHKDESLYKEYLYYLLNKYETIRKKTDDNRINNMCITIKDKLKLLK
jgi:tRNA A22 N-methylase